MKHYTYVLFDWDGTIGRTLDIWSNALKETLEKRGYFFSDAEIGANYEHFRKRFHHLGSDVVDSVVQEALLLSERNIPSVELYTEAYETLTQLHGAKKRLGLVTTSTHASIDPLLKRFSMVQLFDAVVCGDDVTQQKPHKEPIIAAMRSLAAIKSQTVMVGDSDKDIIAARHAGVDSILFYPPEHRHFHDIQELGSLEPTYIIRDFRDVIDIIG